MGLDLFIEKKTRASKKLAYFRKVNFLISFIEDYYAIGVGNGKDIEIDKDCITELYIRCAQVLQNHSLAEKLLPTQEGFFFGNTDYNDNYFHDVENVRDACINLLDEFRNLKSDEYIVFNISY